MLMRFLPDEPITSRLSDILGIDPFVQLVQNSIYNTETPFVYGILGDWGTGKTSAMEMLKSYLNQDLQNNAQTFVPIWFNAWKYENEENVIYPLLHAIKRDYQDRLGIVDDAKDFGRKLVQVVATSTIAFSDIVLRFATKNFIGEAMKLSEIEEQLKEIQSKPSQLEKVLDKWAGEVDSLHQSFQELIDIYAHDISIGKSFKQEDVRFVIMIDDLDRCLPETTIAILENIKNFLSVKKCVFVLGLNPKIVSQGIRVKYQGANVDGREYLEKIINYSFYIPEPDDEKISEFGIHHIHRLVSSEEEKTIYSAHFNQFGQVLKECQFNNPRKIKRILNRFLFFIGKYGDDKYYIPNIVRLIIIAEYFPVIFQILIKNANAVLSELEHIGNDKFDISRFQERFGLDITDLLPMLIKSRSLFQISRNSVNEHVGVVFSATRIL